MAVDDEFHVPADLDLDFDAAEAMGLDLADVDVDGLLRLPLIASLKNSLVQNCINNVYLPETSPN